MTKPRDVQRDFRDSSIRAKSSGGSATEVARSMKSVKEDSELIDTLVRFFINRSDTYALQMEDGSYTRVNEPLSKEVLKQHLAGKITVGTYQLHPKDNSVRWICFDVDPEKVKNPLDVALRIYHLAKKFYGDTAVLFEASRYPDPSFHVWILFEPPIPAKIARFLGQQILKIVEVDVELFPKQQEVGKEGFGNLVKLPLGLHQKHKKRSCFLDPVSSKPLPDDFILEKEGTKLSKETIDRITTFLEKVEKAERLGRRKFKTKYYNGEDPVCIQNLLKGVEEGIRNEAGIRLVSYWLNFRGFKAGKTWAMFNEWNTRNKPPLDTNEMRSIMRSASSGGYNYGCNDEVLKRVCEDREHCPLKSEVLIFDPKIIKLARENDVLDLLLQHLGKNVKRNAVLKRLILRVGISAYSENPLNLFLKGPSSTGKTYNAVQALKYFPEDDVWSLGGLSPTALVHGYGVYDEGKKAFVVDLEGKVLVFLESPHVETYMRLRPILSHDKLEIAYKFTDRTKKGGLKTRTVIIHGWPATIFCTTQAKYVEDLATRGFTVTPEMSQEKYEEAIKHKGERKAFPSEFEQDEKLAELKDVVSVLKYTIGKRKLEVKIPYGMELSEVYPHTLSRDMRDFDRFTALIDMTALFNAFHRPILQVLNEKGEVREYVLATRQDFDKARRIASEVFETTRVGLPGNVIDFHEKVVVPLGSTIEKITYSDLLKKYLEVYGHTIGRSTLKTSYVDPLEQVGWIDIEQDPQDRRKKIITLKKAEDSSEFLQKEFSEFFDAEKLEKWFENLSKYFDRNRICIIASLFDETPLNLNSLREIVLCQNNFKAKTTDERPSLAKKTSRNMSDEILKGFRADQVLSVNHLVSPKEGKCENSGLEGLLTHSVALFNNKRILVCDECGWQVESMLKKQIEAKNEVEINDEKIVADIKSILVKHGELGKLLFEEECERIGLPLDRVKRLLPKLHDEGCVILREDTIALGERWREGNENV